MSPDLVAGLAGTALDDDSMGIAWNLPSILKTQVSVCEIQVSISHTEFK